jgi:ribosomal-protein-alanine N-acetyltransferase
MCFNTDVSEQPAPRQIIIETDRLILRRVTREEAELIQAFEEPEGITFAEGYPGEFSLEVMDLFVGDRASETINFDPWFIVRKEQKDVIGEIGFSTPLGLHRPTVGYDIVEPLWRNGYASEALEGLLTYLFTLPEVESVEADTFDHHIASRRVMEKAGMNQFDTRTQEVDGEEHTLVFYEIWRPEEDLQAS